MRHHEESTDKSPKKPFDKIGKLLLTKESIEKALLGVQPS